MALKPSLLAGPLTFAFTDIEGSTARWERDRAAMQDAVRRHDAILRAAIVEHGGHVFKTIGDAFCAAFARPEDAIAAMLAAQQALSSEDFSAVDGVRVRAAIHTGTADHREGDYFGPPVNKVARLLAIGHGSQVLLTSETAELLDGAQATATPLRDLGAYHLKDFAEPQRVYQLLAPTLPADFPPLRSLGTLPSDTSIVDTAQFHPVPTFSGREAELAAVHEALRSDGAIVVVHGMGGVGKSSIAREYGWRNRDAYSIIWWLNAQTDAGIIDGLVRLGAMFVKGLDQLDDRRAAAERVVNSVLGGFDKPVLLVFDNLEEEGLLRTWLPRTARALATSRDTAWSTDITAIPLPVWTLDTAADYLLRASGRSDVNAQTAQAITQALGALPLALSHAAAALRNLRMVSPQRYLERVNEHLKNAPRGAEYPRSVFATFSTAIAQAEQQAAGAAAVLCFAASFAPDAIPDELFRQSSERYAEDLRPSLANGAALDLRSAVADELRLDEALGALDRLSLLAFAPDSMTYTVHRLVQFAARDLAGGASNAWAQSAVAVADAAFPEPEFATWPQCGRLLPHARAALDALASETGVLPAGRLFHRCGVYLWRRGEYSVGELLCTRALAIRERALGPDHPDVGRSLSSLGNVYVLQGRYDEGVHVLTRALAIREKSLGPDHPDVARSLNNLGTLCAQQGRYDDGTPMFARALVIWEKSLGPDHPDVARSLNNLGNNYTQQGRYAEAEPLLRRALAVWEKAGGCNNPDVPYSLINLGDLYREQGRYAEAESVLKRALAIWEKALGADHADVAHALNGLARVHHEQGRYDEAERLHAQALAIREKALSSDHPYVAQSLEHLANVYAMQGRYDEATLLHTRALAILESALGPDHPQTRDAREKLGKIRSS
jgi:class 3 adenylate cyclase/tetratricopeptide (TPR) repeat protein